MGFEPATYCACNRTLHQLGYRVMSIGVFHVFFSRGGGVWHLMHFRRKSQLSDFLTVNMGGGGGAQSVSSKIAVILLKLITELENERENVIFQSCIFSQPITPLLLQIASFTTSSIATVNKFFADNLRNVARTRENLYILDNNYHPRDPGPSKHSCCQVTSTCIGLRNRYHVNKDSWAKSMGNETPTTKSGFWVLSRIAWTLNARLP